MMLDHLTRRHEAGHAVAALSVAPAMGWRFETVRIVVPQQPHKFIAQCNAPRYSARGFCGAPDPIPKSAAAAEGLAFLCTLAMRAEPDIDLDAWARAMNMIYMAGIAAEAADHRLRHRRGHGVCAQGAVE
jgi:hypothetical protein